MTAATNPERTDAPPAGSETFEQWYKQYTGKNPTLANARYYALTKEAEVAKAAWSAAIASGACTVPAGWRLVREEQGGTESGAAHSTPATELRATAWRMRYKATPGMIGTYPWSYSDAKRPRDRAEHEIEDLVGVADAQALLESKNAHIARLEAKLKAWDDRDDLLAHLDGLLRSDVGRSTLQKLSDGQGTMTVDGQLWIAAKGRFDRIQGRAQP